MKKRLFPLFLALAVALTGCASMLERSYESTTTHVDKPTTAEDPSVLRVENYRELISAVLYLVSQGQEEGVIQFHGYAGEVEADLTAACLEVATEDPLGAYAVDYIKHESVYVVSDYQATVTIHYQRSAEQIRSIVNVTGTRAIRTELQEALAQFSPEVVLRVAYFAEDMDSIAALIRQAYYDTPVAAMGMPQIDIALYPDTGRQRVVEILLTYPETTEELTRRLQELSDRSLTLSGILWPEVRELEVGDGAIRIAQALQQAAVYDEAAGATAYDAVVAGSANGEGMALAYTLLCRQANLSCEVVEGTLQGRPWFWNALELPEGTRYLDAVREGETLHTAQEMVDMGYRWPGTPVSEEELQMEEQDESEETTGQEALPE